MGSVPAPTAEARIASLAQEIDAIYKEVANDERSRKELFNVIQGAMGKPHAPAALMVMIRSGVLTDLVAAGKAKTAKQLAESTGASETLIIRMMRPLTALGIFREVGVSTYESAPISQLLTAPPLIGGYQFMFDLATRSLANMPRFLEKTGFQHVDGPPGPFQDSNATDELMFPYLMKHPAMMTNFNAFMAGSLETREDWFRKFDAQSIVLDGARADDPDAALLIDIAGGEGHDVQAFGRAFPDAPGKLVLQDLPPVIANIKQLDAKVVRQPHDMFDEQPVKGARAYYMRNIFHDWPNDRCVDIMKRIAAAMAPGYSKLLIFEWVLVPRDVPLYPALLDVNMMALLNGRERTEDEWRALLAAAGLKAIKFHTHGPAEEGLIEAELA
ncbi:S-adenosyl-L-methionine-dependent methyltransferase [Lasiosphaeria miniovina]|uniref:S-adenosyl-L-methionine-dependent methyltransferase n=1 Tax=Lasiosphaeria miniovina TaxID=1954250 RepID=A0AA40DK21_9PEZI|nr:S-adenosyl-L-methionine-dependent methyltransferase [Lasiosphaeria miniovina]KAK0706040.1 S-adenosyl-L-methionine-dependent methyltransferase [Lasiosphaeria miniovina]